jgi:hypothetical protein
MSAARHLNPDPVALVVARLEARGCEPKPTGSDSWEARCPAHEGTRRNLSVGRGDTGAALVHCHHEPGCELADVLAALDLKPADLFATERADQRTASTKGPRKGPGFVSAVAAAEWLAKKSRATSTWMWPYRDDNGRDVMAMIRLDDGDGGKTYRPVHRRADGWHFGDPDGPLPLYNLPVVRTAEVVVHVEGEKAADVATRLGLASTTTAHGAKSPGKTDLTPLAGKRVVIVPDHDEPGEAYALGLQRRMAKLDPRPTVSVVRLESLWKTEAEIAEGSDLAEWVSDGVPESWSTDQCRTAFMEAVEATAPVELDSLPRPEPKKKTVAASPGPRPAEVGNKPLIVCGSEDPSEGLKTWTPKALAALSAANHPTPSVYLRDGTLCRLRAKDDGGPPTIEIMGVDALRGALDRAACWGSEIQTKRGPSIAYGPPRLDLVKDVLAMPSYDTDAFPPLDAVAESPRFLPGGRLVMEPGYHREGRLFYSPSPDLAGLVVPEKPTSAQVAESVALLRDELLCDFPFADQASRANSVGLMLLPFVRLMIDGPTPLHHIEASTEGTGKGLLGKVLAMPSLGRDLASTPQKESEAEWRKAITSALMAGSTFVFWDNLANPRSWDGTPGPIDSGTLAAALTERVWRDRLLGGNTEVSIPIRSVFASSGNNVAWSLELKRRLVRHELMAPCENPSLRTGFRHDPLLVWAKAQRRVLTHACLILCRHWIAEGMPPGGQVMGSYESYARTIGGILMACGIEGFLANRKSLVEASPEAGAWSGLVEQWHRTHSTRLVSTADLWKLIRGDDAMSERFHDRLGEGSDNSQKTRLGKALEAQENRVWGGWRITRSTARVRNGVVLWRLRDPSESDPADEQETEATNGRPAF